MTVQDTAYRLGQLEQVLREEQASLWYDLDRALRDANNGVWSIEASDVAQRIARIARHVYSTPWDSVPWDLVAGGVFEAVLQAGGVVPILPSPAMIKETEPLMTPHGGTVEQHRARFAATVEKIRTDRETRDIRGEEE